MEATQREREEIDLEKRSLKNAQRQLVIERTEFERMKRDLDAQIIAFQDFHTKKTREAELQAAKSEDKLISASAEIRGLKAKNAWLENDNHALWATLYLPTPEERKIILDGWGELGGVEKQTGNERAEKCKAKRQEIEARLRTEGVSEKEEAEKREAGLTIPMQEEVKQLKPARKRPADTRGTEENGRRAVKRRREEEQAEEPDVGGESSRGGELLRVEREKKRPAPKRQKTYGGRTLDVSGR